MRAPLRHAMLGVFAAAMLTALAGGAFLLHAPASPEAAKAAPPASGPAATEAVPPLPPEAPRLADGPDYEACLAQLRQDPEGAAQRAMQWEERGGGDGARHCLALALLALGEPDRAAGRLERLAAGASGSNAARASIYAQASQAWMMAGDPGHAYGAATLALTLMPDDPALLVDRALAAGAQGRYAEALEDLNRAVSLDRGRAEAWVFRAAALRHLDRTDAAMQDIETALRLVPQNPEALLERGILRQLKGDAAGARGDWQRAIALAPDSAAADLARQNLALNEAGPRRR
ncbi:tetratricopeptide repeat protein [Teichococcus aestuarii]|uniref:tetratricopeptide repeat protein n=1 Tax=Teichococcus aestuarii TaxID=568898 RepID=UPI00362369BE